MLEAFAVYVTVLFITWVTVSVLGLIVQSLVYYFGDYAIHSNKLLSLITQISLAGVTLYIPTTESTFVTFKWLFAQNLETLLTIIVIGSAATLMFRLTSETSKNRW